MLAYRLSYRALVISLLLVFGLTSCSSPRHRLPQTPADVEKYLHQAEERASKSIDKIASIPFDKTTFDNTLREWNRFGNDLMENFVILTFLTETNLPSNEAASQAIATFQAFLIQKLEQNQRVFESLFAYVHQLLAEGTPDPYENYLIYALILSTNKIKEKFPAEYQEVFAYLKTLSEKNAKQPYRLLKGDAPALANDSKTFTILSLNTCFLPGDQAYLYGGMKHWQKRLSPLVKKIHASKPDIICLQEVFAEDASDALYNALKDSYAFFYTSIGPRPPGVAFETLGLPSGLFVASKYALENPRFKLAADSAYPINYGSFDFIINNGTTSIGHVYTAHLQPHNNQQIRGIQLQEIVDEMQADAAKNENMPYILCGDLNSPFGSQEPAQALIHKYFYSAYNQAGQEVNEANHTSTDYFTNHFLVKENARTTEEPNFQIIDYSLLLNTPSSKKYEVEAVLVPMNDLKEPGGAISDHHGLFTTVETTQ